MYYNNLLYLGIILPLLILLAEQQKSSVLTILKFLFVYGSSSYLISALRGVEIFDGQLHNWVGKGTSLLFLFCLIRIPSLRLNSFNFGFTYDFVASRKLFIFCGLYLSLRIALYVILPGASILIHPETVLYELCLAGLQEEILVRGILLSLVHQLVRTHGIAWGNLPISWAALITTLLFGLEHGLEINSDNSLTLSWLKLGRASMEGLILARLTERTKSLVPAIVYHILLNLINNH